MTSSGTGLEVPVGYRFHPTDEELVNHYLRLKMQGGKDFEVRAIGEVNIYKHEPWDLPDLSVIPSDDQEWFFFCAWEIKFTNSNRSNRLTEKGYWKSTGKDRKIKARGTNNVIGTKKTLVFYVGRGRNGVRTPWVIHEYKPATFLRHEKAFVLCRLFKKADVRTNEAPRDDGDVSSYAASDFEGQVPGHTIPEIHEFNRVDADLASLLQSQQQDYDFAYSLQLEEEYNHPEPSVVDATFTDCFEQDYAFANEQAEVQFVNSFINQQEEYTFEEFRQSNDSRAPEPSIKIYYNGGGLSSDSDTDTAQAQHQQMHVINGGTASSSNRGQYKEKRNGVVLDASSVDSAADIRHVLSTQSQGQRSPPSIGTLKLQYPPRSRHSVEQRAAPRKFHLKNRSLKVVSIDKAKDVSRLSITTNLPQKERSITESDKEQKMAQGTNADNSPRSAGSDRKGSLIFQETAQKGHESTPPLVYFVKILIGIFLFVVFIRKMLLYGNWR
ncbi:NAC domain-containing protein 96-like [Quercus lobata]|uniref:NAC domain-containing protein n=1 Tax=Quercus lobata TaxID=97700 RepID=A0A7N2MCR4_QUELO|nr:NAC domain-containing protein 96-like [Quercus lobata]